MESKKINQLATELAPDLSDLTIIGDPTTGISKKITLSQMASLFTGTVEEYANLAAFPITGVADTIYIALDTNVIYRWDSTAYVVLSPNIIASLVFNDANGFDGTISLVGSVATLTITTALTSGSVPFIGASGALTQDNSNLFFDDTNNRLGIATASPTTPLDVFGSGIIGRLNATSTNNAFLGFASNGTNKWSAGNVQTDHRFRIYSEANSTELVSVLQTGEFGIGIANPTTKFHIDGAASALIANLDADVSIAKSISFRSDNSNRINLEVSGTESGSNAGANFFLRTYTDAGSLIETPFSIVRSTGVTTIKSLTLTNVLSVANGGTGSATQNFVDLTSIQTAAGAKTFSAITTISNATASTSTTTGGLVVTGGVGIGGALFGTSATFSSSVTAGAFLRASSGAQSNPTGGGSVVIDYQSTSDLQGRIRSRDWDGATWKNLTLEANNIILSPTGNVYMGAATGASNVIIGSNGTPSANGTGNLQFINSNSYFSWQISAGGTPAGALTFSQSTTNGGSTFSTERMRIASDGSVGIGATTINSLLSLNSTALYYIDFQQSGTSKGLIGVPFSANQLVGGSASGDLVIRNTSRNTIFTNDSGNTSALKINSSNIITLGSLGTGTVTATSGVLSVVSDMNFKIEDGFIDNALEKVLNLKPRYFHWKEESGLPTDLRQLGFYAQEVNAALGEEVANTPKTENDKWGIYDRGIIAMLTKAIQEQQAQIEELKTKIK